MPFFGTYHVHRSQKNDMQTPSVCGFFLTWVGSYEINEHTFLFQVGLLDYGSSFLTCCISGLGTLCGLLRAKACPSLSLIAYSCCILPNPVKSFEKRSSTFLSPFISPMHAMSLRDSLACAGCLSSNLHYPSTM